MRANLYKPRIARLLPTKLMGIGKIYLCQDERHKF